jgi:putative flippase GtrA
MQTLSQFFRYSFVGICANLLLYLLYLLSTHFGIGHKTAMTALFAVGVMMTFLFNRNWSFSHGGHIPRALRRYATIYLAAWLINLVVLYLFVDLWAFPHQAVQGIMIITLAIFLFTAQKVWVFADEDHAGH